MESQMHRHGGKAVMLGKLIRRMVMGYFCDVHFHVRTHTMVVIGIKDGEINHVHDNKRQKRHHHCSLEYPALCHRAPHFQCGAILISYNRHIKEI